MANFKPDAQTGWIHETILVALDPSCPPYLERWRLNVGIPGRRAWFGLRLHHFFRSDEVHLHDHSFGFLTLVLRGSYEDVIECESCEGTGKIGAELLGVWDGQSHGCGFCGGTGKVVGDHMTPGTIRYRSPLHKHRVVTDGCWTFVLSGPRVRDWGFWVDGKWWKQRRYFEKFGGSAACQDAGNPLVSEAKWVRGVHGEPGPSTWSAVATDKDFNHLATPDDD